MMENESAEIVEIEITGQLTYARIMSQLQSTLEAKSQLPPRWLIDLKDCDNQLMASDVEYLAHSMMTCKPDIGNCSAKIVILVENELDRGMMHMLSAYCELAGIRIEVVSSNRGEALRLLCA